MEKRGYRVKVQEACDGLHPSEVVVYVRTADVGIKHITISRQSLNEDSTVDIGYPVGTRKGKQDLDGAQYLIELPREFDDGSWRVWVNEDRLFEYRGTKEMIPSEIIELAELIFPKFNDLKPGQCGPGEYDHDADDRNAMIAAATRVWNAGWRKVGTKDGR